MAPDADAGNASSAWACKPGPGSGLVVKVCTAQRLKSVRASGRGLDEAMQSPLQCLGSGLGQGLVGGLLGKGQCVRCEPLLVRSGSAQGSLGGTAHADDHS